MSDCPNSSFSIVQESLLVNVHRKLNWGSVSAGTGKIMIPVLCSDTEIAVTFLLPPAPKECKCLCAHEKLSQYLELSRALPCPSATPALPCGIASAPDQGQQ